MEEKNLDGRIDLKTKEIQLTQDPNMKRQLQNDLEILNLRKQIERLRNKIRYKQNQP